MTIKNKDHWAYKSYNAESGKIIYRFMLGMLKKTNCGDNRMVYIDLTNKGNIYIFTRSVGLNSVILSEDFEIYDAIVDNHIFPTRYIESTRLHISKLLTLEKIVEYLKYIKQEINLIFYYENKIKEYFTNYRTENEEKIKNIPLKLKEELLRYKKIESLIIRDYPHLSKYFISDIYFLIRDERLKNYKN